MCMFVCVFKLWNLCVSNTSLKETVFWRQYVKMQIPSPKCQNNCTIRPVYFVNNALILCYCYPCVNMFLVLICSLC